MLTTKTDIMMNVHTELYNTYSPLREECEVKNNVVLLFSNTQSLPVGAARVPIRSVADLQGKKLRTVGRVTEVLKKLGGSPVGMQSTEIYEAARRGVIDGVAALPFTDLGKTYGGLYETMPYIFDWGLGNYSGGTFLGMSLKRFNEFPKDIQKIIEELRAEAPAFSAKANAESNVLALKEYEAAKCTIYMWTPQEMEKARALIVPSLWDSVAAEIEKGQPGVPIKEYLGKVHALVGKYEKQVKFVHPMVK
jgi:TRAP-type C4-dicarboxylate transport system substrate-binding protein